MGVLGIAVSQEKLSGIVTMAAEAKGTILLSDIFAVCVEKIHAGKVRRRSNICVTNSDQKHFKTSFYCIKHIFCHSPDLFQRIDKKVNQTNFVTQVKEQDCDLNTVLAAVGLLDLLMVNFN